MASEPQMQALKEKEGESGDVEIASGVISGGTGGRKFKRRTKRVKRPLASFLEKEMCQMVYDNASFTEKQQWLIHMH